VRSAVIFSRRSLCSSAQSPSDYRQSAATATTVPPFDTAATSRLAGGDLVQAGVEQLLAGITLRPRPVGSRWHHHLSGADQLRRHAVRSISQRRAVQPAVKPGVYAFREDRASRQFWVIREDALQAGARNLAQPCARPPFEKDAFPAASRVLSFSRPRLTWFDRSSGRFSLRLRGVVSNCLARSHADAEPFHG